MDDYIIGMYVGGALGDALGAPHEYFRSKARYNGKLEHSIVRQSRFQGTKVGVVGEITDDTEMTIALLASLAKNNHAYVKNDVIKMYLKFANNCSFLGNNTRALFYGIKTEQGYYSRFSKTFDTQESKNTMQSNGCLMRASALALASNTNEALEDVMLTIQMSSANILSLYM